MPTERNRQGKGAKALTDIIVDTIIDGLGGTVLSAIKRPDENPPSAAIHCALNENGRMREYMVIVQPTDMPRHTAY